MFCSDLICFVGEGSKSYAFCSSGILPAFVSDPRYFFLGVYISLPPIPEVKITQFGIENHGDKIENIDRSRPLRVSKRDPEAFYSPLQAPPLQ